MFFPNAEILPRLSMVGGSCGSCHGLVCVSWRGVVVVVEVRSPLPTFMCSAARCQGRALSLQR